MVNFILILVLGATPEKIVWGAAPAPSLMTQIDTEQDATIYLRKEKTKYVERVEYYYKNNKLFKVKLTPYKENKKLFEQRMHEKYPTWFERIGDVRFVKWDQEHYFIENVKIMEEMRSCANGKCKK